MVWLTAMSRRRNGHQSTTWNATEPRVWQSPDGRFVIHSPYHDACSEHNDVGFVVVDLCERRYRSMSSDQLTANFFVGARIYNGELRLDYVSKTKSGEPEVHLDEPVGESGWNLMTHDWRPL